MTLTTDIQIKAIFIMHTPVSWGEGIQVICDILKSKDGSIDAIYRNEIEVKQRIPIYLANPDFDYCGKFPLPRLTVGAFGMLLNTIWKEMSGEDLTIHYMGKPYRLSYQKAEDIILKQYNGVTHFYGIGDNPVSDIRGANNMKTESPYQYTSVLVKSGCSDPLLLQKDKPDIITDTFYEAIQLLLKHHNLL